MSSLEIRRCDATLSQPAPDDRRRDSRYDVSVAVDVLTTDGLPLSAEVTNISGSGFRAHSPIQLAKGSRVIVRFGKGTRRRAYVAWQIGEEIGCRLLRPLSVAELASVLAQSSNGEVRAAVHGGVVR
jgi:hypothetical protein